MRIIKFGGTSVGTPQGLRQTLGIISEYLHDRPDESLVVVVSAISGCTDTLLSLAQRALSSTDNRGLTRLKEDIGQLITQHNNLFLPWMSEGNGIGPSDMLEVLREELQTCLQVGPEDDSPADAFIDHILSFGERMSALLMYGIFGARAVSVQLIDTRTCVTTDTNFRSARYNPVLTKAKIRAQVTGKFPLAVATGFIGSTEDGRTTTLGRGGSDLTASIFAAALDANRVEIWTDVDGILTADPRKVPHAKPIPRLTFHEAMEMAHFGAKVIFPQTLLPAIEANIEIAIRNTFQPELAGTIVSAAPSESTSEITGVTSVNNISLIRVQGSGLMGVAGTAQRVFSVFGRNAINVILITQASSEYSLCAAIEHRSLDVAVHGLREEFRSEIQQGALDISPSHDHVSIIAVVGLGMRQKPGVAARVFSCLGANAINVIAIAQGSSELNISVVVNQSDERKALHALHDTFFVGRKRHVHIALAGVGNVGATFLSELQQQTSLWNERFDIDVNLVGLCNSKALAIDSKGLSFDRWRDSLTNQAAVLDPEFFVSSLIDSKIPNLIFVDCTTSEALTEHYALLMRAGISIVTSNKKGLAGSIESYHALKDVIENSPARFCYETTVGAALPVIGTLHDLLSSGDEVVKVEAVLSGTLSFLLNTFDGSTPFSELVREAHKRGFTEPNPFDDLSGADVARKLMILGRELGWPLERDALKIEPLVPIPAIHLNDLDSIIRSIAAHDKAIQDTYLAARHAGGKLVYRGELVGGTASVRVSTVYPGDPLFGITGTDNVIAFTTRRYCNTPLIIKGPGAGPEVTAAGILADVLRVARGNFWMGNPWVR